MAGPSGRGKRKDSKLEQFKEVCPPHKLKDLDALVKSLKGDEEEILEKIQEWWEEPQTVEPEWEEANKKTVKKKPTPQGRGGGGGRTGPGRGGRGFQGGRVGGGRGAGPERRAGRSGERRPPPQAKSPQPQEQPKPDISPGPAPVASAPAPKGAWGQRGAPGGVHATTAPPQVVPPTPDKPATPAKLEFPEKPIDIGVVAPEDPTPSGMRGAASPEKPIRSPAAAGGNVWATKGSAHLIQAEKPKPPPPPPQMRTAPSEPAPKSRARRNVKESLEPKDISPPAQPAAAALETGLPSSLSVTPINGGSWKSNPPSHEISQSAPSVAEAALGSIRAPEVSVPEAPPMSPPKPSAPAPANVLNMGHWESGEGDDSQNLDFGFGSFGPESDTQEEPANNAAPPMSAAEPNTTVSPARPPPGLSIGGMPPMPANAVLVHELENKLEGTTLGNSVDESQQGGPKPMTSNLPTQPPPPGHPESVVAPNIPPGTYNTGYGMGYYNNSGNGFMGGPALGVPHQQKPQTGIPGPQQNQVSTGGAPQHLAQQSALYGAGAPSGGNAGDNTNANSPTDNSTTGIPPGMPNAMAYNPALFYGQQPYQMGQPHGQVGYGYGYGTQFGNPAFYQQQVMGQSGGYPSYDEQPPPPQGRGDYPAKSSNRGYRNNGNQYQNQFNPQQHGGYGGQPYNMGYNVDHFNQRGGYGPPDPYGMPQQQGSGNYSGSGGMSSFQDDDRHKGKKGGRSNGSNLHQQFQPHPQQLGGIQPQQPQQQQPFLGGHGGGGGGGTDTTSSSNNGGGGWSNNQGGGWGGPSWQGGN